MEQLEDVPKDGKQVTVPKEQEMFHILATEMYYKVVFEEQTEPTIRTPENLQSLRAASACESGKDTVLKPIPIRYNLAQHLNFTPALKFRGGFTEMVWRFLEGQNLKSQTAVCQLVMEVTGSKRNKSSSIEVQITALNAGVREEDFCRGDNGEFGSDPDRIVITIRTGWQGASVGVERVPDESLGNKSISVEASTGSNDQFEIGMGFSPVRAQYVRSCRQLDELNCTNVSSCFDEHGGACFEWKIVRLKSGQSYSFEKPFMSLMNPFATKSWFDLLPLNGTGVKVPVSEMNRIEWPLPSSASTRELYLDVFVDTRMVFLKKHGPIITPLLVNIPLAAKVKLEQLFIE